MKLSVTASLRVLLLTVFILWTVAFGPSTAQVRPEYPVIFDDFEYESESELLNANWWTDLEGKPLVRERAWFKSSWEAHDFAPTAHLRFDRPGEVRIEVQGGHFYGWKPGWMPPILSSGFAHRTGTWVSRIRFDDIAMGRKTETPQTHAFWTFSPNVVCLTDPTHGDCSRSDKRWSEFNHEWNNYFDRSREQFLAKGRIVDGEEGAVSEIRMRDPEAPTSADLSCRRYGHAIVESIGDSDACMEWFVSDADRSRYVDLMIQYDNEDLVFEAVAYDENVSKRQVHSIAMREVVELGRRVQPMVTKFSLLGNTRDKCLDLQIVDLECWKQDKTLGFSVDWFFYSPETKLTASMVAKNVKWLQENGRTRVNTTGKTLTRPRRRGRLSVVLESPLKNSRREWVAVPSQRSTKHYRLKIRWRYRTKRTPEESWSGWSVFSTGGFTFDPGLKYEKYYKFNVSAIVSDWFDGENSTAVSGCLSDYGGNTVSCTERFDHYRLGENYPDPFNPETTISFEIPFHAPVRLTVYNAIGQEVARLLDGYREEGSYSVRWDAAGFGSGLYFYEMKSGVFRQIKKMVLLR